MMEFPKQERVAKLDDTDFEMLQARLLTNPVEVIGELREKALQELTTMYRGNEVKVMEYVAERTASYVHQLIANAIESIGNDSKVADEHLALLMECIRNQAVASHEYNTAFAYLYREAGFAREEVEQWLLFVPATTAEEQLVTTREAMLDQVFGSR